jgi:hypothetical protein
VYYYLTLIFISTKSEYSIPSNAINGIEVNIVKNTLRIKRANKTCFSELSPHSLVDEETTDVS